MIDPEKILVYIDLIDTNTSKPDDFVHLADSTLELVSQPVAADTAILSIAIIKLASSSEYKFRPGQNTLVVFPVNKNTLDLETLELENHSEHLPQSLGLFSMVLFSDENSAIRFAMTLANNWANQFYEEEIFPTDAEVTYVDIDTGTFSEMSEDGIDLLPIEDELAEKTRIDQLIKIKDASIKVAVGMLVNAIITHSIVNSDTDNDPRNN